MRDVHQRLNQEASTAGAEVAQLPCGLIHLGETAYRAGRELRFDPKTESLPGDKEANALHSKEYRKPWKV